MKEELNQAHILIVEDNEINRLVVETLLKKHFKTKCVVNGAEALKAVEEHTYDIILMDIHLGDGEPDGTEIMKLIRKEPKHDSTKIFAVTAYYDDRQWFIDQGFDDMYTKPVIKEEMLEAINNILTAGSKTSELNNIQHS